LAIISEILTHCKKKTFRAEAGASWVTKFWDK